MKGVYSSPDAVEENEVNKALFPDTPYRFESGGYPEEIPTLTQEMFLDFHKTYYSPRIVSSIFMAIWILMPICLIWMKLT